MDLGIILLLIVLNGIFAMSEIAVVSSRKARLQRMAEDGSQGAAAALKLHSEPSRFLSTIQVGITSIGILSGAVGEAALADPLTQWLSQFPLLGESARVIALSLTVVLLTYMSVVVGELVPKQLALLGPEGIASLVARPMGWLSRLTAPLVWLFSASSGAILRLFGARRSDEPPVTDDEIKVLMGQGAEAGVFHESEQEIVSNVLRLDEQRVAAIMTPRKDMYLVDLAESEAEVRRQVAECPYARVVVCQDGLDRVLGILQRGDLLKPVLENAPFNVRKALRPPVYVPESVTTTHLLESLRRNRAQFALVIDEYGEVQGLVTLNDVLAAIVGDMPSQDDDGEQDVVEREDGSYLMDGGLSIERLKSVLEVKEELPGEEENAFHTLGGLVMHQLGRVPVEADHFHLAGWRFEVVDMDKNRVDKVLLSLGDPETDDQADAA
ncbi:hemolysin family protein [Azospira oryzae]|jgi:putative hemolysin|uniref:CBS domain-containing protein n=3 Tax=Rhodocyclaceae TaxID=75787 RepID=G8QI36_AZOOP|nr:MULTISPECIES: hemolysin family protein [Azospira]TLS17129.1 MAG: HlyC/CorC family transporter [Betaproteobacteria bacterium]AEV27439.1 CBS domain-containing protein [Azospira oryzae PS]MBP7489127.1 HlyC/CorC family transporter [Azospira sp.]MDK9689342.1 hemolysin family protein [Azospira sp.]RZT90306.1 putative hemolysin [Azospira oryzae]